MMLNNRLFSLLNETVSNNKLTMLRDIQKRKTAPKAIYRKLGSKAVKS